jgi:hypothetical protein
MISVRLLTPSETIFVKSIFITCLSFSCSYVSSGRETSWEEKNEKPSVRKELGDIRKEQEEKRKRPDRRKNARERRKKRKNMKTKGR